MYMQQGVIAQLHAVPEQWRILQMAEQDLVFSDCHVIVPSFKPETALEVFIVV